MQENDVAIGNVLQLKLNQIEKPSQQDVAGLHPESKILIGSWNHLEVKNDILYKKFLKEDETEIFQLIAPKEIR